MFPDFSIEIRSHRPSSPARKNPIMPTMDTPLIAESAPTRMMRAEAIMIEAVMSAKTIPVYHLVEIHPLLIKVGDVNPDLASPADIIVKYGRYL